MLPSAITLLEMVLLLSLAILLVLEGKTFVLLSATTFIGMTLLLLILVRLLVVDID